MQDNASDLVSILLDRLDLIKDVNVGVGDVWSAIGDAVEKYDPQIVLIYSNSEKTLCYSNKASAQVLGNALMGSLRVIVGALDEEAEETTQEMVEDFLNASLGVLYEQGAISKNLVANITCEEEQE